jgi:hypothetical protein
VDQLRRQVVVGNHLLMPELSQRFATFPDYRFFGGRVR